MKNKAKILVAGIGGASLGTEIIKSLSLLTKYDIYGCDISPLAYGHFVDKVIKTFTIDRNSYILSIIDICIKNDIRFIIPGGEEPMVLLNKNKPKLDQHGIILIGNSSEIIEKFSNKALTFQFLKDTGFKIPITIQIKGERSKLHSEVLPYPCIIKPSTGSGGSNFVFLAGNKEEAKLYIDFLLNAKKEVIVQEYIPENKGEYTVGVLSLPNGELAGSVILKRILNNKLSISTKTDHGIISSGYSQGLIDDFPIIKETCERIASLSKSKGPMNIQGRIKDNEFIPFEINPRFSASTYLRALADFNEIDIYLDYLIYGKEPDNIAIKNGYYLRSFDEVFVDKGSVNFD